jgi:hypothetical protein
VRLPVARALACAAVALACAAVHADELSSEEILGRPRPFVIDSIRARFTHFDQEGRGYQSQADRAGPYSPGLETATIEQPQLEVVAQQGKFTHRLWVPIDVITAASPDAIDGWPPPDTVTEASHTNVAGSLEVATTYHKDRDTDVTVHAGFHLEAPFRSWDAGVAWARGFAEQNTVLSASLNQIFDWLDAFDIHGLRVGRDFRSSTNANLGITQLLSPTTVGHLDYGVTVQLGQLSNTWNVVPLSTNMIDQERLPSLRHRHAFVARLVQALPWHGIVKGMYRFYVDDWGVLAHTFELQLYQRLARWFYLKVNWRVHTQTAPWFWTLSADPNAAARTADSDLAALTAQTFGVMAALDTPLRTRLLRELHVDFGYERYFRTNSLSANIYTCSLGFRF